MALTPTSFVYEGITIGEDGPYYLDSVDGWFGPTDAAASDVPVAGGHGSMLTPLTRKARQVTVSGICVDEATRDSLFWALEVATGAGFGDGSGTNPLSVTAAGATLTADAQLLGYAPVVEKERWPKGVFGFALRFRCPDPLKYGPLNSGSASITASTSAITFPAPTPWVFPAVPPSGQIVLSNAGNAPAPAVYTLNGPLVNYPGIDVAGKRVTFGFDLGVGDTLVIDTAAGGAKFNGGDRSSRLGSARTAQLTFPVGTGTVQALGDAGVGGTPWVTASFRPAYW